MIAIDVSTVLPGICRLTQRSNTLDGSIPLRAAQACLPLLEGNAYGLQVTLEQTLVVERGWRGTQVRFEDRARGEQLVREARALAEMLAARNLVTRHAADQIGKLVWSRGHECSLFTGLFVRAPRSAFLRVSGSGNRRVHFLKVDAEVITERERFMPLVLKFRAASGRLRGELATIGPLGETPRVDIVNLHDQPDAGSAFARFFDDAYFTAKKSGATRKYKRELVEHEATGSASITVVRAGDCNLSTMTHGLLYRSPLNLTASFDGMVTRTEVDPRALAEYAASIEATWSSTFGTDAIARDRRALWYLTKFVTPHQDGEPHFFVKPAALIVTSPGWCTLVDGVAGEGYNVMRGMVATDQFFATPAVFALNNPARVHVPIGAPLMHLFAIPRSMMTSETREISLLEKQ